MTLTLKGGSALRARLNNIAEVPKDFAGIWAETTVENIRQTKPPSTRPASSRFTTRYTRFKAGVYGAFWWILVDRGTKAHDIVARKAQALRFESKGETIFAKRVHLKRMKRRPFISKAAQQALSETGTDVIVQAWNGRRRTSHKKFL